MKTVPVPWASRRTLSVAPDSPFGGHAAAMSSQPAAVPPPHVCKEIPPVEKDIPIDDCVFRSYKWPAAKDNWKGRVLFVHGYRDHHQLYNELAESVAKAGFDFFFFYQRGEGESRLVDNSKGVSDDYYAYKALDDMIEYNLKELSDEKLPAKLHLMGASMGGGLILNYACHGLYRDKIKSLSALSPLIVLHKNSYPGKLIEYIVRTICVFDFGKKLRVNSPLNLEYITGDEEYQKFMRSLGDTKALNGAFVETRDFILRGRNLLTEQVYSGMDSRVPVFICHGENDNITDVNGSKAFISALNSIDGMENKKISTYPDGRHQLTADIPGVRHQVIADLINFLTTNKD